MQPLRIIYPLLPAPYCPQEPKLFLVHALIKEEIDEEEVAEEREEGRHNNKNKTKEKRNQIRNQKNTTPIQTTQVLPQYRVTCTAVPPRPPFLSTSSTYPVRRLCLSFLSPSSLFYRNGRHRITSTSRYASARML